MVASGQAEPRGVEARIVERLSRRLSVPGTHYLPSREDDGRYLHCSGMDAGENSADFLIRGLTWRWKRPYCNAS